MISWPPQQGLYQRNTINVWCVLRSRLFHIYSQNYPTKYPGQEISPIRNLGLTKQKRMNFLALNQINSINTYGVPAMGQARRRCQGSILPSPLPHQPSTALGTWGLRCHNLTGSPHTCQGSTPPLMYISGRGGRQGEMRPPSVHSSAFEISHTPALAPSFNKTDRNIPSLTFLLPHL